MLCRKLRTQDIMFAAIAQIRVRSTLWKLGRYAGRGRMNSSVAENEARKGDLGAGRQQLEAAAREDRLDLLSAAKILFSTPAKPKKFGLDFHLWQLFAACMPPFAVYLTAQYARYEIRRLEQERDETRKLLLQTVVAEEVALRLADEGEKTALDKSDKLASVSTKVAPNEERSNPRSNDTVVRVSEQDLQAMKSRLEILERKLSMLEGVQKETEGDAPGTSQPGSVTKSKDKTHTKSAHDEYEVQNKRQESTVSSAESEGEQTRRTLNS